MVLVRFCARALLQQLYRRDFVEGAAPGEAPRILPAQVLIIVLLHMAIGPIGCEPHLADADRAGIHRVPLPLRVPLPTSPAATQLGWNSP